jgi:two-component system, sensor histidine kinase LadS
VFVAAAASIRERSALWHRVLWAWAGVCALAALAVVFAPVQRRMALTLLPIAAAQVAGVWALLWAWRRGDRYARWLVLGFAPLLLLALPAALRTEGWLPFSFWTLHGMQIGSAIELPILLVALMLRSSERRESLHRIRTLDRIDPATGLIKENIFHDRLEHMIMRAKRLRQPCGVLMIELRNLQALQEEFGPAAASEMPLHLAQRLMGAAREIDSVARLSETRFGMLIEGPLKPSEAAGMGARVLVRCLAPLQGRPQGWSPKLRVAQAVVPLDGTEADIVLDRLGLVLETIAPGDPRSVFPMHG